MLPLLELKERLDKDQVLMLNKRIDILFRHNSNRKHPVIQHLIDLKSREIILKMLGERA